MSATVAMRGCPSEDALLRFLDGRADPGEIDVIEDHLDGCDACRVVLAGIARSSGAGASPSEPTAASGSTVGSTLQAFVRTPGDGAAPLVADRVIGGQYRVVRAIGHGGMGVVYLARDVRLDRDVAIKVGSLVSGQALERIEREAVALARFSHPNVVVVHQVGEIEGRLYIAMEYVAQGNAREWLGAKPRTWREIVALYGAAGDGLAAAHAAGLVHRDFKPDNVLVGADDRPRVADFGLVRQETGVDEPGAAASPAGALASITQTGAVIGTPAYMAPEQIAGGDVDARADQFAFCTALWEALFAQRPFPGRTPTEVADAIASSEPRRPGAVRGVPARVVAVVRRGLSRDRALRWPSMAVLLAELRRASGARRRAIVVGAAAAFALTAIAIAIGVASAMSPAAAIGAPKRSAGPPFHRCSAERWCWDEAWVGTLGSVWGAAPDDVWASGMRGTLRHYDGHRWTTVLTPVVADLGNVSGTARDDVWVGGEWGTMLHYDGRAWTQVPVETRESIGAVWARARDDAWAAGPYGHIEHWDGTRWKPVASGTTATVSRIAGTGRDDVWFAGDGIVVHWDGTRMTTIDTGRHEIMDGLRVFGPHDMWISGFHSVLLHGDGAHWTQVPLPELLAPDDRADHPFDSIGGSGPDDVWALSKWSRDFLHWDGHAWTRVPTGTRRELFDMFFFSRTDGWAVGVGGLVVHWDGHAWTHEGSDDRGFDHNSLWGTGADDVWIAEGRYDSPHSVGRVEHWDGRALRVVPIPPSGALQRVAGRGDEVWFSGGEGTVLRRTGGAFERVSAPTTGTLHGLWLGTQTWVAGDGGTILRWDGAWHPVPSGTTVALKGIWGSSDDDLWAVGEHGTLLHGVRGVFTPVASGTDQPLETVWGTARDDVWVGGDFGFLLHFDGRAWSKVDSDTVEAINSIEGSRPDDVWAVTLGWNSTRGTIIHWNGHFWTAASRTPREDLRGVWAADPHAAWAVGGSSIFHYGD